MYRCLNCGKEVEIKLETARKIQCPYCGYRILKKDRPKLTRRVEAE
jgi:DNA-directed RNA polymerase subunit RPC12/RpoP